jgi:hypothetical protein
MPNHPVGDIAHLPGGVRKGEPEAEARLMELTYRELRKIATGHIRRERTCLGLQTVDLVPDAYLREVLGVSARAINREWRMARAWLNKELYQ